MIAESAAESATLKVLLIGGNSYEETALRQLVVGTEAGAIELECVSTLAGGLQRLRQGGISLAMLDLSLPESQGAETFSRFRAEEPFMAVIVLGAKDDDRLAVRMLHEGAQDYLVKGEMNGRLLSRLIRYAVERKRREVALEMEREFSGTLEDNIPDRIYFKDTKSRFLRINRAMAQLFHLRRPEDAVGKTDFDMFLPEHASQAFVDEARIMETGRPLIGIVEKETFPDGSIGWAMTTKLPFYDRRHNLIGTFGISRDVTVARQSEESLKAANAELARSQKQLLETLADLRQSHEELKAAQLQLIQAEKMQSLGRMAAGVAHEVKNPLATLRMCADYLARVLDSNDREKMATIQEMKEAVNRADTIIRGLLDFSAPRDLDIQEVDLNAVVEQSLLLVRHGLSDAVHLVKDLSEDGLRLRMDPHKMEQVLVNVFTNAIDAMGKGGELVVRSSFRRLEQGEIAHDAGSRFADQLRTGENVAVIEVLDNGTGIPEEKLARVFDPFFTTKSTGKGTGLGLTVAKSIVEMHGGQIQIRNRKEGGAAVTVLLKV